MSHNPLDWSDGIPDCIIFASTADAERGAAMYRSMADAIDAKDARILELKALLGEAMDYWVTVGTCSTPEDVADFQHFRTRAREALK